MSGVIMGGAQTTASSYFNYRGDLATGKNVLSGGYAGEILATAKHMTETMAKDASYAGYKVLHNISDTYEKLAASLEKTGGEIKNARQKAQLGALNRMEAATRILTYIEQSAGRILSDPAAAAERFKSMNLVDADGNPVSITAEALTKGFEGRDIRDLRRAISNNPTLATLAIADATGKLMLGVEGFTTAVKAGTDVRRADYQHFLENASAATKQEVASRLGLSGSLDAVSFEEFLSAARQYTATPDGQAAIKTAKAARRAAESVAANEKTVPRVIGTAMKDGTYRYGGENGIAILKEGDTVRIYDYATRTPSRPLSVKEASNALQQRSGGETAVASEERRYAIPVGDEIVDARTVTEEDVRTLLQRVQSGEYRKKLISR